MSENIADSRLFDNFINHRFDDSLTDWIGQDTMDSLRDLIGEFLLKDVPSMEVEIDILKPEGATEDLFLKEDEVYFYSRNKDLKNYPNCISNYDDFKYSGSFQFTLNKGESKIDKNEYLYTNGFQYVNHATKVEVKLDNIHLRNNIESLEQFVNLGALNTIYLDNNVIFNYNSGKRDLEPREDPVLYRLEKKDYPDGINFSIVKKEASIGIFSKNKEYGYNLSDTQLTDLKAGNAIYRNEEKQKDFFKLDAKKTTQLKREFNLKKAALNLSQKVENKEDIQEKNKFRVKL